ncbi:MAG: hypothetical protein J7M40_13930 [Planctomycetes bacterium]|nr:hypothetical protein [Planctomycetota bacterium]
MLLPKRIRKFIAIFRGGVSPLMITLSIALGFTFGLIPGFYGIHALILILFVLLNIHLGLFLLSGALAKTLCLSLAPLMYHLGGFVQTYLAGLLGAMAKMPILGLTDFSRYSVAAAMVAGPVAGLIFGLIMARLITAFRKRWLKLETGSEAFQKWCNNRWVRILDRILVGKRTKDVRTALAGKSPVIRKAGVVLAIVLLLICAAVWFIAGDEKLTGFAAAAMTKANGAEVNIASMNISATSGKITATQIQATNPKEPAKNQLYIGKFSADAGVYNMLCGRIVADQVELSDVRFDTQRQTPGEVLKKKPPQEEPFDPDDYKVPAGDIGKLETYFENAKKLKEFLQKIQKWLPKSKKTKPEPEQIPQSYLEYLAARAQTTPTPRVIAKKIVLDQVDLPGEQFGKCKIILTNISDAPAAAGLPVRIEIQSQDDNQAFDMTCRFDSTDNIPAIEGRFKQINLKQLQSQMSDKNPIGFESGTASGSFKGTASAEMIDMNILVNLENLQADSTGKGMLGLDAKTSSEVLGVLKNLTTTLRLIGPPTDPRIAFDTKGLTNQFQNALVEAGKERLNNEVQKQLDDKLGDKLPTEIKDVIKNPDNIIKGIGDLFGGKKEE